MSEAQRICANFFFIFLSQFAHHAHGNGTNKKISRQLRVVMVKEKLQKNLRKMKEESHYAHKRTALFALNVNEMK